MDPELWLYFWHVPLEGTFVTYTEDHRKIWDLDPVLVSGAPEKFSFEIDGAAVSGRALSPLEFAAFLHRGKAPRWGEALEPSGALPQQQVCAPEEVNEFGTAALEHEVLAEDDRIFALHMRQQDEQRPALSPVFAPRLSPLSAWSTLRFQIARVHQTLRLVGRIAHCIHAFPFEQPHLQNLLGRTLWA